MRGSHTGFQLSVGLMGREVTQRGKAIDFGQPVTFLPACHSPFSISCSSNVRPHQRHHLGAWSTSYCLSDEVPIASIVAPFTYLGTPASHPVRRLEGLPDTT